jgi:hypothetical protein
MLYRKYYFCAGYTELIYFSLLYDFFRGKRQKNKKYAFSSLKIFELNL